MEGKPSSFEPCMDEEQYKRQTAGVEETWEHLIRVLQENGPFDGILGFSQVLDHCLTALTTAHLTHMSAA